MAWHRLVRASIVSRAHVKWGFNYFFLFLLVVGVSILLLVSVLSIGHGV